VDPPGATGDVTVMNSRLPSRSIGILTAVALTCVLFLPSCTQTGGKAGSNRQIASPSDEGTRPSTPRSKSGASHRIPPPQDEGYRPFPLRILSRSTSEVATFDPKQDPPATVSYRVSKQGEVRLRLVRRADKKLVFKTLQDWTVSRYGTTYSAKWDGKDASGNWIDNKGVFVLLEAKDDPDHRAHESHAPETCKDFEATIVAPASNLELAAGESFRVEVKARGLTRFTEKMRGRAYVDYLLVQEREFAKPETEYGFELPGVDAGTHMMSVVLDDHRDHVGSASMLLHVTPSRD